MSRFLQIGYDNDTSLTRVCGRPTRHGLRVSEDFGLSAAELQYFRVNSRLARHEHDMAETVALAIKIARDQPLGSVANSGSAKERPGLPRGRPESLLPAPQTGKRGSQPPIGSLHLCLAKPRPIFDSP